MKKQIISFTLIAAGFLIGASALSALASGTGTWTAPTATPPGGNIAAPINVGNASDNPPVLQTRYDPLHINGNFGINGNFVYNPGGTITQGMVLVATDTSGSVGWSNAAGGSNIVSTGSDLPITISCSKSANNCSSWTTVNLGPTGAGALNLVPSNATAVILRAYTFSQASFGGTPGYVDTQMLARQSGTSGSEIVADSKVVGQDSSYSSYHGTGSSGTTIVPLGSNLSIDYEMNVVTSNASAPSASGRLYVTGYVTSGVATPPIASQLYSLGVTINGSAGNVTSNPAGINCDLNVFPFSSDCNGSYPNTTSVNLTATPGSGGTFTGWSGGGCSGTGASCTVSMSQPQSVTATFSVVSSGGNLSAGTLACTASPTLAQLMTGNSVTLTLTGSPSGGTAPYTYVLSAPSNSGSPFTMSAPPISKTITYKGNSGGTVFVNGVVTDSASNSLNISCGI